MSKVVSTIHSARKALVAVIAAAFVILGTDSSVLNDVVAVLTALGVYSVPNK
jgi:hypothetical protein